MFSGVIFYAVRNKILLDFLKSLHKNIATGKDRFTGKIDTQFAQSCFITLSWDVGDVHFTSGK